VLFAERINGRQVMARVEGKPELEAIYLRTPEVSRAIREFL
jgi:hypothetical protein